MKIKENINQNIFRGYDIRGVYPMELDEDTAYTVGLGFGSHIKNLGKTKCIIGHDNRLSSPVLFEALKRGILDTGIDIISLGLCTTPMYYYACIKLKVFSGIMVTASHNPKDDNGFKFSFDMLANARGEMIEDFKNYTFAGTFLSGNGTVSSGNITEKYVEFLRYGLEFGRRKRKVVIDIGNGTTSIVARKVFEKVNIDAEYLFEESDGRFPNHHPDPVVEENLEALKKEVIKRKADCGIAFDGDGDRLGIVDEKGNVVPSDHFMILIIRDIISKVKKNSW